MASARPDCSVGLNRGNCDLSEDGLFHKMFHAETFGDPPRRWHPPGRFTTLRGAISEHYTQRSSSWCRVWRQLFAIKTGWDSLERKSTTETGSFPLERSNRARIRHKTSVGNSGKRPIPRSTRVRSWQLTTPIQASTAGGQVAAACTQYPFTALVLLTVLRRISGSEGGPTKVTNLTVIPSAQISDTASCLVRPEKERNRPLFNSPAV